MRPGLRLALVTPGASNLRRLRTATARQQMGYNTSDDEESGGDDSQATQMGYNASDDERSGGGGSRIETPLFAAEMTERGLLRRRGGGFAPRAGRRRWRRRDEIESPRGRHDEEGGRGRSRAAEAAAVTPR